MKRQWTKHLLAAGLMLCLILALVPVFALAASAGWTQAAGGWQYYENGAPLSGVCWIEAEGNRYLFDENGMLQTGGAEGDVLINGSLYYINPEKDPAVPATCYAVHDYARVRAEGVSYYNADGITFAGWMDTADGGRMYQTCLPRETVPGALSDVYIYVWRAQYLPESRDPADPARTVPEGWYLFDDSGLLIQAEGWHDCGDGLSYRTNAQGRILETAAQGGHTDAERPADTALRIQQETMATQNTVLERTNAFRAEAGVPPLALDASLSTAAALRAWEMARAGVLSHTRPNGTSCFTVYDDFGWTFGTAYLGENIARLLGASNPDSFVCDSWKNSPAHYRNMTDPDFTRMGVGVYTAPDGRRYYAQLFAADAPKGAAISAGQVSADN